MAKFFIGRPIVAMVIAILMVIVGVIAMLRLPRRSFRTSHPLRFRLKRHTPAQMR